jgi:DNA-binding transcriptional regulator LsrR (DeoR family)
VNGTNDTALSLGAVPDRIPTAFFRDEGANKVIREFLNCVSGYNQIYSGPSALVHQIDTVLTSVGSCYGKSNDPWLNELVRRDGLKTDKLDRLTRGDIGGVFLPRDGLTPPDRQLVEELNQRWTGISEVHLRECARRASAAGRPGVIILAVGRFKAEVVRESVRRGLVNELIVDQDLAGELARQL